jgi:hypothetical protein
MYQSAASERSRSRDIPLWFREGMASVTAGQEHRAVASAADRGSRREQGDPLTAPEPLYRSQSRVVYEVAHRAFRLLLDRFGEERIRRVIAGMREGHGFPEAFRDAVGIPVEQFEGDFNQTWLDAPGLRPQAGASPFFEEASGSGLQATSPPPGGWASPFMNRPPEA